jgi:phosphatidylserine/phosphatidylglycerophosphate/cardiolipin synthase-like enzyme
VRVRIAFNEEHEPRVPVPPPPSTEPDILETLGVPLRGIPGVPDLMHHKYAVRDGAAVLTGSTNWTTDSWTKQENLFVEAASPAIAAAYARNFEQLWRRGEVAGSGLDEPAVDVGGVSARPWFTPGRGRALSHRIAEAIGRAERRVRIASPVITAAPVLAALAQEAGEGRLDIAGVVDATQMRQVVDQWGSQDGSRWKIPVLESVVTGLPFSGKPSQPWAPGSVHDFMHAKVTVADDVVFAGSFNLSRSGEQNAENVLEIRDAALAAQAAAFIDEVRARYAAFELNYPA